MYRVRPCVFSLNGDRPRFSEALKQGLSPFVILNLRQGMEEREAATGLSEAREAAGAIAKPRKARFLLAESRPKKI